MTRFPHRLVAIGSFAFALTACDGMTLPRLSQEPPPNNSETVTIVARDVEAPEVFSKTANARWDGRPTIGGVWVSHPDAVQPERAIIRNVANGQFVVGSLYPGQAAPDGTQVVMSAEAANALGIPAGAVQSVAITALRPEQAATVDPAREQAAPKIEDPAPTVNPDVPAPKGLKRPKPAVVKPAPVTKPVERKTDLPSKPYVQLGIFSVESNANKTAARMNKLGIATQVSKMEISGKAFWRVIAGPAKSEAEKQDLLKKVKAQGFADAYFVSG